VRRPSPERLKSFACRIYHLGAFLKAPGDDRRAPRIPAEVLLWGQVIGHVLREASFHGMEALARSPARKSLGLEQGFGDDALGYFDERLRPQPTREALASLARQAKNNKAFDRSAFIGLAVDGTGAGLFQQSGCSLCRAVRRGDQGQIGYQHKLCLVIVVGTALPSPSMSSLRAPARGRRSHRCVCCSAVSQPWVGASPTTWSRTPNTRGPRSSTGSEIWAFVALSA